MGRMKHSTWGLAVGLSVKWNLSFQALLCSLDKMVLEKAGSFYHVFLFCSLFVVVIGIGTHTRFKRMPVLVGQYKTMSIFNASALFVVVARHVSEC